MKTMKNILYALFAVVALVMVGCTKDQTYTPGGDLSGEQIYIDNTTSTFYVKTAAEKQEEAEELKKLSKGLKKDEVYSDDTCVDLKIVRKNTKLAMYEFDVELTMLAEDVALFMLPTGSTQTGANSADETVTYTVPCVFDEGAPETTLRIGFNIANLANNTDYEFVAKLADSENTSNYGADTFEFVIAHTVPIELPFEDIGKVTIEETFFRDMLSVSTVPYKDCIIQIHKDDKKAIDAAKAAGTAPELAAGYVRFFIPRFMYQIASASVAAGDGAFVEEELDYYAQGCGLMLCMTPQYEWVVSDLASTYPHPLHPDKASTGYPCSPVVFIDSVDGAAYAYGFTFGRVWAGTIPLVVTGMGELEIVYFDPSLGYSAPCSREMNVYSLNTSFFLASAGNLWDAPIKITWDVNDLEEDGWADYFKVDYNNDVTYYAVGDGIFTSEYQGNFATKTLYQGVESVSGNTVYYVSDAYATANEQTGNLGLAMTWNGSVATVTDMQPLNIQWNGRELYASQSKKIKSVIEFNEKGAIKKITFGVAIVNEDGGVLGDYAETLDIELQPSGLESFLGTYTHIYYSIFGSYDENNAGASLNAAIAENYATVTIEQAKDSAGNPIANKVWIKGMIDSYYTQALGGVLCYLEATYDPTNDCLDVPAQFFRDIEWDGEQVVGAPMAIFPYFQPGVSDYNAYNYGAQMGMCWTSEIVEPADKIAISRASNGVLLFGSSSNSADVADGYAIVMGYNDGGWVTDYVNMSMYSTFALEAAGIMPPMLVPGDVGGGAAPLAQKKFAAKVANAKPMTILKRSAVAGVEKPLKK